MSAVLQSRIPLSSKKCVIAKNGTLKDANTQNRGNKMEHLLRSYVFCVLLFLSAQTRAMRARSYNVSEREDVGFFSINSFAIE